MIGNLDLVTQWSAGFLILLHAFATSFFWEEQQLAQLLHAMKKLRRDEVTRESIGRIFRYSLFSSMILSPFLCR